MRKEFHFLGEICGTCKALKFPGKQDLLDSTHALICTLLIDTFCDFWQNFRKKNLLKTLQSCTYNSASQDF